MSPKSAGQAVKLGYSNVRVMLDGEPGWVSAGYPLYAGYGFICRGNIVLIDLRSPEKDKMSRIPRSVSMPFATLEERMDEVPIKAPVVLYSDSMDEMLAAYRMFRDAGYQRVSLVDGGYQGWKKLGGTLIKGPVVTTVNWKRKLKEGEVALADFNKALADDTAVVILDVRTKEEAKEGKLARSLHIPLDELVNRIDEVRGAMGADKKLYIHCTTGTRAEMAYHLLKKNGFARMRYLVAEVECEGNDCEIED